MSNALRGRINQLADRMEFAAECKLSMRPTKEQAADIRALLAAHAKAERELAACKAIIRLHTCTNQKHNSCRDIRAALKEKGVRI